MTMMNLNIFSTSLSLHKIFSAGPPEKQYPTVAIDWCRSIPRSPTSSNMPRWDTKEVVSEDMLMGVTWVLLGGNYPLLHLQKES